MDRWTADESRTASSLKHPHMRHIFPILMLCTPGYATSQSPVIGTAQFFEFGQTYVRDGYDPPEEFEEELVQASGPDYTIDLSPVSSMFLYHTEQVVRGSALEDYGNYTEYYDTANTRISVHHGQFAGMSIFLFLVDTVGIRYVGGQPNGSTGFGELAFMRYPDNGFPLELEDDMSFGFTHLDTIHGQLADGSGSDEHYFSGTSTIEADGYGTIIMPDGQVIPNTLRLRNTIAGIDSNGFFGLTKVYETIYTWYAEGISCPIMSLGGYALSAGYLATSNLAVYRQSGELAIPSRPGAAPPSVFPNPFAEEALLTWPGAEGSVTITDAQGRVVWCDRLRSGRLRLQGTQFAPGLYAYVIGGGGDPWTAHGTFIVH